MELPNKKQKGNSKEELTKKEKSPNTLAVISQAQSLMMNNKYTVEPLYANLSQSINKNLHSSAKIEDIKAVSENETFVSILAENFENPEVMKSSIPSKIKDRAVPLDSTKMITIEEEKEKKERKKKPTPRITSKDKRAKKLLDLGKENKYEEFLPLHQLWLQYVSQVITEGNQNRIQKPSLVESKFLKLDYHGAIIKLIQSKNPSSVGHTGIVVQETKSTFKIITKDNKIKTLPKQNSVFTITLEEFDIVVTLFGNHFCFDPADRSSRKFKPKDTTELF